MDEKYTQCTLYVRMASKFVCWDIREVSVPPGYSLGTLFLGETLYPSMVRSSAIRTNKEFSAWR